MAAVPRNDSDGVKGADLDSNKFVAELPCGAPEKDMENREDLADDDDNGKNEEEYVNGVDNSAISVRSWKSMCSRILLDNVIPDDCRYIGRGQYRIKLFDSIESIRVVKFSLCTIILVIFWNWLVKLLGYEHDEAYDLPKFFYFDIGSVVLDCVLFSIIGRLYKKKGVDRLFPFIIPAALSCFHGSWSSEVWFLKHSLTLYNMACKWPWQLWIYAVVVVTGISTVIGLHIRALAKDGSLIYKLVEMMLIAAIFVMPIMQHPALHLHHYFTFWLLGMFFNREEAWSQIAMALSWGQYIHGVGTWGRDSALGCAYSKYVSAGSSCPAQGSNGTTQGDWDLDWRKCNGP